MQIFVLGTGRSGTHWVGHILESHPDVRATIEKQWIFRIATQAALQPRRQPLLLPVLRGLYVLETFRSRPQHYADKSHPVIWYAEELARWFPQARFVGVERNPFGTVASMLRHRGVSSWQENWQRYDVPNPFLGIQDAEDARHYGEVSAAERGAMRWKSHSRRLAELKATLGERMLVLDYDRMMDEFEDGLKTLWGFLGLDHNCPEDQRPRVDSKSAWRQQLTPEEVASIARVAGITNPLA